MEYHIFIFVLMRHEYEKFFYLVVAYHYDVAKYDTIIWYPCNIIRWVIRYVSLIFVTSDTIFMQKLLIEQYTIF